MSAKRAKRHHYVPKVLQKAFCCEGEHIWYSLRDETGRFKNPEDRNIESTFRIKDLYTVLVDDDQLSDEVERSIYGQIDDYLGRILPQIYNSFKRGEVPIFVGADLDNFRKVIWEMIKRTPDFIKSHDDLEIGRTAISEILAADDGSFEPERRATLESYLKDDAKLTHYGRDIRVRGSLMKSEKVEDLLREYEVRWAVIKGEHSFLLSSLMAYRIGNGGSNGLINPKAEIWFPVSPKIAVVLVRDPEGKIPPVVEEFRENVRKINEYAAKNSNSVASHSKKLLRSLTKNSGRI